MTNIAQEANLGAICIESTLKVYQVLYFYLVISKAKRKK